ncbi:MAG TPA: glycosyltransferase family 1 protein [Gemmataceae bacterium]|jgi:glycosyltransferase involved in cell wall biosynthesis|nr:glycosyltransferase family 1 protein [Gemmataceae bacterium]
MSQPLRILLATDAWRPQVNGVVRTWETSLKMLHERGHTTDVIRPGCFRAFSTPLYPEISLALPGRRRVNELIHAFRPDVVHVATEGPIGLAVRAFCVRNRWRFSTSYHSKFPEYLQELAHVPVNWSYRFMRWFHSASSAVMVSTPTLEADLAARGFRNLCRWSRGVDLSLFYPRPKTWDFPRPIMLYAGRVSKEKNVEAFLTLDRPGTKVIVGDGPIREKLAREYPKAKFLGYRTGAAFAEAYANADVFVFPSKTDTFGLVMIEAMACGVPVAAYPVVGPIDVVTERGVGCLNDDLGAAVDAALRTGDSDACVRHARQFTWERCTDQLLANFLLARDQGERSRVSGPMQSKSGG